MSTNCPDCGTTMEFEARDVHLRTGVCPSCAKEFAFLEGSTVASRLGALPSVAGSEAEGESDQGSAAGIEGFECAECGSPLSVRGGRSGTLEVSCEECDVTTVFVPQPEGGRADRVPRGREGPRKSFDTDSPRGRPCRKCGNPVRISTREDGVVVGECESCGNRFTLPPRSRDGGGGGRFDRGSRYGRSDYRRGPGRGRPYAGRRDDRGGSYGRPERREGSDRYEGKPRRRRRRDSEEE